MARKPRTKEPVAPQNDAGGDDLAHWDPKNPRDMGAIRRMHTRYPGAFRDMDAEKQAKLVRIWDRAANAVNELQDEAEKPNAGLEVKAVALTHADSVMKTGVLIERLRLTDEHHAEDHNQRERHHEDDLAVAKANAMSNAANAGLIPNKTYLGLDPGKV